MDEELETDTAVAGWEYSVADYVRIEAESELIKHEFDNGQIRAMGGGTPEHARLASQFTFQAMRQLHGRPCAVYSSDSRVRSEGLITYPALSIGCGDSAMDREDRYAQLNPCVLVEITSKSSERYDRGLKRLRYQQIPSLRDYVIVSHREHAIDVFSRAADGTWPKELIRFMTGAQALIPSLGILIDVDELYQDPRKHRA